MDRGSVEVSGPLSDTPLVVRAGQHLVARIRQRETTIRDLSDQAAVPAHAAPVDGTTQNLTSRPVAGSSLQSQEVKNTPAVAGASGAAPYDRGAPDRSVLRTVGRRDRWQAAFSRGEFESIVVDAERLGIDACLSSASAEELSLLADAARYGRHDDLARRVLFAERSRFSNSTAARDASFLLGRLQEADADRASAFDSYARYLKEAPAGAYASEALGRQMILAPEVLGDDGARNLAQEYLRRFPGGPYAARARLFGGVQ
jgi:TolA-binding protein